MSGIWLTQRPFDEVIHDLDFIVPLIDLEWFADARWLQRKNASISGVTLHDWVTLSEDEGSVVGVAIIAADFEKRVTSKAGRKPQEQADGNLYNVPLLLTLSEPSIQSEPLAIIKGVDFKAYVYDATGTVAFATTLLGAVKTRALLHSKRGHFQFERAGRDTLESEVHAVVTGDRDTTNTVIMVDSSQVIKVYRRLQAGTSPDIEMSKGLSGVGFSNIPRPLGYGVYSQGRDMTCPAFFIQEFVENQGDAWDMLCSDAFQSIKRYLKDSPFQEDDECGVGHYMRNFGLREVRLGAVTAGLHCASSGVKCDRFTPEAMRREDAANLVRSIVSAVPLTIEELRRTSLDGKSLGEPLCRYEPFIQEGTILRCLRQAEEVLLGAHELGMKIRIHGDLHLGQFLRVRGKCAHDFVIIDFEGEPLRPVYERLKKSSPLRDVAGMLRSFDYSGYSAAFRMNNVPDEKEHVMRIAREWGRQTGEKFLEGYRKAIHGSCAFLLPQDPRNFQLLLQCFKLEKALYEVRYELRNRPGWVAIALQGTLDSVNEIRSTLDCGE